MIINFIKIPFVSAFPLYNYVEGLAFGIAPSGEYIETRLAIDDFESYLTGFRTVFSGSGYWLTSGSTSQLTTYFNDNFVDYPSGIFQNNALNEGFIYQGYNSLQGATTGNLYVLSNYMDDGFENYSPGTYSGPFLSKGINYNGYNEFTGVQTGVTFGYISDITGGGGGGGGTGVSGHYWRITYIPNVSSSYGYIDNGYFVNTGIFADYLPITTTTTGDSDGPFSFYDFTVEFWMRRSGWGQDSCILAETNPNIGFSVRRYINTDTIIFYANNASIIGTGLVNDDTWTHIAAVRQNSGILLYQNGFLDASGASNTGQLQSNYLLTVGCMSSLGGGVYAFPYVGSFDELRVWNYARSQSEIQANLNTQITSAPGLVNYLTFDS